MDKRIKYGFVIFLFVALVLVNSVLLMDYGGENSINSGKSILKNANFEKYIDSWREKTAQKYDFDKSADDEDEEESDGENAKASSALKGGVVIEQSTKRVLLDEGKDVRCYPASTTKILTAIIAIERLPLNKILQVPKCAEGIEGSSLYLKAGQKISVEDLLFGLMLRSGNDCAATLALEISGSTNEFASVMNQKAREIGALNSNFVNPHGLHDENHYTTAYDLALICAYAYDSAEFVKIVSTKQAKILIDDEPRYIANKNKLLRLYEGANGAKTGYTKRSGRCLVGGAKREGMQLVSVVLNYNDMWNDTIRMLNFCFDNYEMKPFDASLIDKKEGMRPVEISGMFPLGEDWREMRYPLRKDGSEYVVIKPES